MPVQTQGRGFVFFPDGAEVSIQKTPQDSFVDIGCISTAVNGVLNYDENQVELANCAKTAKQLRNMTIAGGFTLVDLDPSGVELLSGGLFTVENTTNAPTSGVDDQVILSGWTDKKPLPLSLVESNVSLKASIEPTLISVTGATDGALVANDDYTIIPDDNSTSGYSIVLNTAGTTLTTTAQDVTIDFDSVTPIASQILYAGSSTVILAAYAMRIRHTDSNGKIRQLELYSVDANSGGFAFNFKGANEDGVEEMPLSYTANIDDTKTDGRQLLAWTIESGAE